MILLGLRTLAVSPLSSVIEQNFGEKSKWPNVASQCLDRCYTTIFLRYALYVAVITSIFIGPESDHWLYLSLTDSLPFSIKFLKAVKGFSRLE